MLFRNAGSSLQQAVSSILQQSDCLKLLLADGGSIVGSSEELYRLVEKRLLYPDLKLCLEFLSTL